MTPTSETNSTKTSTNFQSTFPPTNTNFNYSTPSTDLSAKNNIKSTSFPFISSPMLTWPANILLTICRNKLVLPTTSKMLKIWVSLPRIILTLLSFANKKVSPILKNSINPTLWEFRIEAPKKLIVKNKKMWRFKLEILNLLPKSSSGKKQKLSQVVLSQEFPSHP